MNTYAIVLAGGIGQRMGLGENKVFTSLRGIPAIVRATVPFSALCKSVVLVARAGEEQRLGNIMRGAGLERLIHAIVPGGATRQASVACGLKALPPDAEAVLVHDGARALLTAQVVKQVLQSLEANGSGVAAIPVTDTVKQATPQGLVQQTLPREGLFAVQTPQGFTLSALQAAHRQAEAQGYTATDDATLLERAGFPVHLCPGDSENIKLTTPLDLALAEQLLLRRAEREALSSCE